MLAHRSPMLTNGFKPTRGSAESPAISDVDGNHQSFKPTRGSAESLIVVLGKGHYVASNPRGVRLKVESPDELPDPGSASNPRGVRLKVGMDFIGRRLIASNPRGVRLKGRVGYAVGRWVGGFKPTRGSAERPPLPRRCPGPAKLQTHEGFG